MLNILYNFEIIYGQLHSWIYIYGYVPYDIYITKTKAWLVSNFIIIVASGIEDWREKHGGLQYY